MKALIINEGSSENIGDQSINFVTHKILEDFGVNCEWQSYSCHVKVEQRKFVEKQLSPLKRKIANNIIFKHYLRIRWWKFNKETLKKYRNSQYDIILIGGGQLLNNSWLYPFLFKKWTDVFQEQFITTIAIGLGTNFNFIDKKLIIKGLANCKIRTVRDYYSKSYIENKFHLESMYIPDPVFKISDYLEVKKAGSQAIVLPVSFEHVFLKYNNPISKSEYLEIWMNKINEYVLQYETVIVSITDMVQDRLIFEDLKKFYLTNKKLKFIIPDGMEHLVSLIGSSAIVYSGRMHALIIGYSYDLKCEVYPVSKKLQTFEREFLSNSSQSITSLKNQIENGVLILVNR